MCAAGPRTLITDAAHGAETHGGELLISNNINKNP